MRTRQPMLTSIHSWRCRISCTCHAASSLPVSVLHVVLTGQTQTIYKFPASSTHSHGTGMINNPLSSVCASAACVPVGRDPDCGR